MIRDPTANLRPPHVPRFLAGVMGLALLGLPAWLQGAPPDKVEGRVVENLVVRVPATDARCMAALEQDKTRLLVVGEGSDVPSARRLWMVYPDAKGGIPSQTPVVVPWPKDVDTAHPVSMICHPREPILYVWRHDAEQEAKPDPPEDFAHLLVYAFGKRGAAPELQASLCRGVRYSARALPSFMNLDPEGKRLFLPNLRRQPDKGALRSAVGYLQLGEEGLPRMKDDRAILNLADVADFQSLPNGRGFCPVNPRLLLMATEGGLLLWDVMDRRAGLSRVLFPGMVRRQGWLAGDERRVYWAGDGIGTLVTMRHAEGYPTLLPDIHPIEGAVFSSPPVVLTGNPRRLAVGARDEVVLAGLQRDGSFSGRDTRLPLPGQGAVTIMAWMPGIQRLYLPFDGTDEP